MCEWCVCVWGGVCVWIGCALEYPSKSGVTFHIRCHVVCLDFPSSEQSESLSHSHNINTVAHCGDAENCSASVQNL